MLSCVEIKVQQRRWLLQKKGVNIAVDEGGLR